ncbi:MAG: T9SS type A sorting domain-containing protein [Bacteroidetes bacterium]|nr:T9SS type A sorting domain-containing protein [Bacteroidota bacterium]
MKSKFYSSILLFSIGISSAAFASSNFVANDTRYEVRYITDNKRVPDDSYQTLLRKSSAWKSFYDNNPSWSVLFNEENQKPVMAYGEPIPVSGATVQDKALNFINTQLLSFKLPLADLSLKSVTTNAEKFDYANFFQTYQGLKVLDSRVMIKMTKAGEVVYFKTDVFSGINISTSASITEDAALNFAKNGFTETITNSYAEQGLKILPVPQYRKYEYHLVYEVYVETYDDINKVPTKYYTLVDANDGKILYRKNKVDHFAPSTQATVTVNGTIYLTNPYGNPMTGVVGLPHLKIVSGGTTYTDAMGVATNVNTGNATLTLEGLYSNTMTGTTTPSMTSNITGNPTVSFDSNSNDRERSAYYHVNIVHDFMKSLPQLTTFTTEDIPINTYVDVSGSCNAFYNGAVNFYAAGGGCNATSIINDVVYHEYGHGLNYDIYSFYSQSFSNGAMGEGYSDVWGMSITNSPIIGEGFYTANQSGIRRYDPPNRKVYPQDIVGEVHADGEIIAGAWWEVNLNMGNNLAFMSDLFIKTFPAGPNGPDGAEGQVYMDVLIAALQADDNDGNICNGTPNSGAILPAFSAHGITLYTNITVTHTPVLTATPNTTINITANATASSSICTLSGGTLFWRTSNSLPWNSSPMTYSSPTLSGTIPGQSAGTIVQYYFEVGGIITPTGTDFSPGNIPYYIMVGFTPNASLYSDMGDGQDFGTWTPVSLGNSTGTWIIAAPVASGNVQPGTAQSGTNCAVTGNAGSASDPIGTADIDGGTTRIESPSFSLASFTNPAITYYRSYSDVGGSNPGNDPWVAEISNDNGTTWTKMEDTYYSDVNWRRFAFKVLDYTTFTAQMKVRFTASDSTIASLPSNGQSVSEAALDEFQVWDGPLSTTGINQSSVIGNQFTVYPNPSNGMFNVQCLMANGSTIEIYNVLGEKVFTSTISPVGNNSNGVNHEPLTINLDAPSGIYQLNIKTDEGTVTKKVSVVK